MRWIIFDFFNSGTDTPADVLTWIIRCLVEYPTLQEECYKAIKEEIGDKTPDMSDRSKLPIVEAFIYEAMRLRPQAPMGFGTPMPHATLAEAGIGSYVIPKDAMIMPNAYAIHTDPAYWKNPLDFDPRSHFIGEDGSIRMLTSFMPFGLGRRSCLGEALARKKLFIGIVRLLQKVKLDKVAGEQYNITDADLKTVAKLFSIQVVPRD